VRKGEKDQSNLSIKSALILPTRTSTIQEVRTSAIIRVVDEVSESVANVAVDGDFNVWRKTVAAQ